MVPAAVVVIPLELPRWVPVRRVADDRGALVVVDEGDLPFIPRRTFVIHDVAPGAKRGEHAHKTCDEALQAFGGLSVTLDDGEQSHCFRVDDPARVLHVPAGWWITLSDFAPGTSCVVYCSQPYAPEHYLKQRADYLVWRARS